MPAQRHLRPALLVAALAALFVAPAQALGADCPGQELVPAADNTAQVEAATLCLLNAERTSHGLGALRSQDQLRRAALGHSTDMVDNDYFAHDSLDGSPLTARIDATGYVPRNGRWRLGENIGWGSGDL